VVIGGEEYGLMEVISGMPHGSILGPILFTVFVNDLECDVVNRVWKFADDVKIIGNKGTVEGVREFMEDLTRMEKWAEFWQMGCNRGTVEGVREFREDLTRMKKWAQVSQMGFNLENVR